ncbi:uncharacterized protein F4817DRAFT_333449 [Daldinia loculata]|uniref:uncharacterized protein n=1 Tax=Daldinia loculata TaxID=103429 RepID=UPI0020C29B5E|nr:uncharacterized protein F4817DRAFT_333449 [Daldinia loculata]KAI1648612.1 hypothetical protein F4817DRAFT_333449 [Daldinia loculata]
MVRGYQRTHLGLLWQLTSARHTYTYNCTLSGLLRDEGKLIMYSLYRKYQRPKTCHPCTVFIGCASEWAASCVTE